GSASASPSVASPSGSAAPSPWPAASSPARSPGTPSASAPTACSTPSSCCLPHQRSSAERGAVSLHHRRLPPWPLRSPPSQHHLSLDYDFAPFFAVCRGRSCYGRPMPVLDAKGLNKSWGTRVLLDDVDVTILRGEKVGLVGDNGSGKSTLGKILAGIAQPDTGEVRLRREARVRYLEQEPPLPAGKTALELVSAELHDWNAPDDPIRILSHLGIDALDQDVATMSGGERRRVALAAVLVAEPDLAILDEPTNHL